MRHEKFLRKGLLVPLFLLMLLGLLPYGDVAPTHGETAQVVEQPTCILTPDLLGGQGFSASGLGFSVSGLGFSVSGLGFSVSGLGFSVSGLGLDPAQVAQEIRDNPISAAWLDELLPDISSGAGFNTTKTALLVIDDFSGPNAHGSQVMAVFDELATVVDMSNILIVPIDVSGPNVAYETGRITGLIRSTIEGPHDTYGPNGLVGLGYTHFVLNLSFGIVPCDDPGPMIGDMQMPPFNFGNGLEAVNEANEPSEPEPVHPVLECVEERPHNKFRAYFGYESENDGSVTIPIGDDNFFETTYGGEYAAESGGYHSWQKDRGQPRLFEAGRQEFVFTVEARNSKNLEWTLEGPDGSVETIVANAYSTPCEDVPPSHSHEPVTPTLQCVADLGDGLYEARFGYENANDSAVTVGIGYKNKFGPDPRDRGQTFTFLPGVHEDVFRVEFYDDGGGEGESEYETESYYYNHDLEWTLKGPDYHWRSVTATGSSPACFDDLNFGMDDYLEGLGVPEDMVDEYFQYLTDSVDDEDQLEDLRGLLQEYLAESATSNGAFTVIPVASAGNFRPWLGTAPLAPARWPEMVAVSATLGNRGPQWQFAQDGNTIAPGAGFPLSDTQSVAGTSFAAPFVSMVSALWSTYPNACVFDGVHPPLEEFALPKNTNAPFPVGGPSPLACYPNHAPEVEQPENQVSNEGEEVELQIVASDQDEDGLMYSADGLPEGLSIDEESGLISGYLDYDTSGNYNVTVVVSDGQATTEVEFMWTVVDVPQTAQCFATEVVSYAPGTKKNGRPIHWSHNDPEEALGAPEDDYSSNYVALGFGDRETTGVLVLGFAPSVIVNDNGHAPDFRVWETSKYKHHHWITYPEKVRVEASQDGENWVFLGITTRADQAYDLKSLDWAAYVRLTDISNRHSWRFNGWADGFDVDAVEGFACTTDGEEEPPMVAVPGQWVESDDALVSADGWWGTIHTWQASGGSYQYTAGHHSEMSLEFIGTSIEVIYPKHRGLGVFTVFIDNVAVRTIVQHSWHSDFQRHATFAYLEDGQHTIEIVPVHGITVIDAFYVPE